MTAVAPAELGDRAEVLCAPALVMKDASKHLSPRLERRCSDHTPPAARWRRSQSSPVAMCAAASARVSSGSRLVTAS